MKCGGGFIILQKEAKANSETLRVPFLVPKLSRVNPADASSIQQTTTGGYYDQTLTTSVIRTNTDLEVIRDEDDGGKAILLKNHHKIPPATAAAAAKNDNKSATVSRPIPVYSKRRSSVGDGSTNSYNNQYKMMMILQDFYIIIMT